MQRDHKVRHGVKDTKDIPQKVIDAVRSSVTEIDMTVTIRGTLIGIGIGVAYIAANIVTLGGAGG